ncbi:MAG: DUF1428 domain-containing protein [Rhizobium sp.]|nr:DUF1428 domain-containing protein [Rhizobium sp.]
MTYVTGFVVAVPEANRQAYVDTANAGIPLFREFGAQRQVEAWDDDVQEGKVTDFRRAVQATPEEKIVFSWHEYLSKSAADEANSKIMSDPRMEEMGKNMPFDARRMIWGGFEGILERGSRGRANYIDGSLVPTASDSRAAYLAYAEKVADILMEHGATRVVDAWSDNVPDGMVTDFRRSVNATPGEAVIFSWVEWPSKAARDAAWEKIMTDPRMFEGNPPQDESRRVSGGFVPVMDA